MTATAPAAATSAAASFRCAIVIPARYASSRLPGKPLADILGKPMIQHVWERACEVRGISDVVVATDDQRVADAVLAFGGRVVMTSPDHASGTDRLVEVMAQLPADAYVNIQGDEPLIRPGDVQKLVDGFIQRPDIEVSTLCHCITPEEALNPNMVKTVLDANGVALYFSRSPIPYPREGQHARYLKHVGVYGYSADVLRRYGTLPQSMAEKTESLEQLRLLHAGVRIHAFEVEATGPGVDTPEGLEEVRRIMTGAPAAPAAAPAVPSLADIKLLITDVDGVLTDGGIFYDATGECLKRFHVRDGMGMRMLEENGVKVAILSGRDSATLRKRASDLQVSYTRLGVKDKGAVCRELIAEAGLTRDQAACIGDDSIDLPAFRECAVSYAVADAPPYVKAMVTHVLTLPGGSGALREVSDAILVAQGKEHVFSSADGYHTVMNKIVQ